MLYSTGSIYNNARVVSFHLWVVGGKGDAIGGVITLSRVNCVLRHRYLDINENIVGFTGHFGTTLMGNVFQSFPVFGTLPGTVVGA